MAKNERRAMSEEKEYCPSCWAEMQRPFVALSRKDNQTYICPECGILEALYDYNEWVKKQKVAKARWMQRHIKKHGSDAV
jgi:transposase-like protein